MKVNFEKSYPMEIEKAKKENWPVLLPIGTMEYHSHHCPFGCDGLVSLGIAEEIAKREDVVILPPVWYGCASYAVGGPEKNTIDVSCDVFEAYIYNILKSLFKSGFTRNICILIFHQTEEFLPTALVGWWGNPENADFYKNMSAQDNPWNFIRVFSGGRMPDMYPCDHAGKYECAMLESLYPGSIKLERLDYSRDWFAEDAKEMDVNTGAELVERAVNSIINAIKTGEKCY